MVEGMPTLPELPSALVKSPHFQIERVRRHTKDEVEGTLAKHDTTMREYWVLACVDVAPMSQRQLSELLIIDASDMVRLIDSLEKLGWVTGAPDPDFDRRKIVAATKKGTKALAKLGNEVAAAEDRALEASSQKQLKSLKKLSQAIETE